MNTSRRPLPEEQSDSSADSSVWESGTGPGWRVLLATPSTIDQKLTAAQLAKHGHIVRLASDGPSAVRDSAANDLDVVIIDDWLPGLDGREVVLAIRQRERATPRRLPILVMLDDDEDVPAWCREATVDGVVGKPVKIEEFTEHMLRAQRSRCTAGACSSAGESAGESVVWPIRWEEALEAVGGRRDLLAELVEIFFDEYPPILAAIRAAIEQHDAKGLRMSAHKLKGCLRYFGRTVAAQSAKDLEDMGRADRLDDALEEYEQLAAAVAGLLPGLRAGPGKPA